MRMARSRALVLGAILALAATACSDDDADGGAAAPDAAPEETAEATVVVEDSDLGEMLADAEGRSLYVFLPDDGGESTCYDDCEATWPPLVAEGDPVGGEGVDGALLGTTDREDGSMQVTYGGWPLYHFSGDQSPDDVNGQGVGDVWFVASPQGEPIQAAAAGDEGAFRDY